MKSRYSKIIFLFLAVFLTCQDRMNSNTDITCQDRMNSNTDITCQDRMNSNTDSGRNKGNKVCNHWDRMFRKGTRDGANSIQQTTDGGYIVAGYTNEMSTSDVWVIKLDKDGKMIWNKRFGNYESEDIAYSIQQTTDGGYILAGQTERIKDTDDPCPDLEPAGWIIKLDKDGNKIWDQLIDANAYSIQQTTDGGYIVITQGPEPDDRSWVIKLDKDGQVVDGNKLDENKWAEALSQTTDGGYVVAGFATTRDYKNTQAFVIKFNKDNSKGWEKTFGGKYEDIANSIRQIRDGGFIVAGQANIISGEHSDVWVIRLDNNGNQIWANTFGNNEYGNNARSAQQTTDGLFIVAGYTRSSASGYSAWIIKLNKDGNKIWDRVFDEYGTNKLESIQQTTDGCYVAAGYRYSLDIEDSSNAWIVKIGEDGIF